MGVGYSFTNINQANSQKIEYKIRFQNTGNDTAFTVVVRDTLDTDLDIFSVRSGVASHAYTFRMYGSRILEWTFNSIMLTDSSTNEAKSHGFVCFEVNQNKDLADGTLITNHADIYFDFNSPIITNTTSHKISRNVKLPAYSQTKSLSLNGCDTVFYNGYQYTTAGNYYNLMDGGINPDTLCLLNVSLKQSSSLQLSATECDSYTAPDGQIYTTSGIKKAYYTNAIGCDSVVTINLTINTTDESVTQNDAELTANATNGNYQWLDCLDNYAAINGENNQTFAPAQNGSYALQVMQNNCIDTSACFDITTVGILENTLSKEMQVFPNPTKGNVSISLGSIYELVTVKLSDAKGAVLSKKEYTNTALIELSINAAPGVYFIEVSDSNSKKALVRVVKE